MALPKRVDPSDVLVLLAVSRAGSYVEAAESLGLSHTTVSRRVAALEAAVGTRLLTKWAGQWELTDAGKDVAGVGEQIETSLQHLTGVSGSVQQVGGTVRISSTAGFAAHLLTPALGPVLEKHPRLVVEITTATRRATQQRPGVDIEVVVGEPSVVNAEAIWLGDYDMALYASETYLERIEDPESVRELIRHPFIYFVESMLQVDELDRARARFPEFRNRFASTDVLSHVEATRAGLGIGLLCCYMADRHPTLRRILPERYHRLSYWLVCRPFPLQSLAVREVVRAIRSEVTHRQSELTPPLNPPRNTADESQKESP